MSTAAGVGDGPTSATRAVPAGDEGADVQYVPEDEPRASGPGWSVIDLSFALALGVVAVVTRRHVLPHDGLFGDDAWQALGAMHASPAHFLTVGFSGPGFTAVLSVWHTIARRPEALADVAFAAGVLGPAVFYLVLRRIGNHRSICLLIGSALAAERLNIIYSGRVKSYVIDALVVLGLAAVVSRFARRRWNWRVTLVWVVGAVLIGFFSPFALLAAVVAGVLLLVRPCNDIAYRFVGVGAQGFVYVILSLEVRRTYDVTALQQWWQRTHDGFIVSRGQPFGLVSQTFIHLRRVAAVFSGGPPWWATLCLGASIGVLILDAVVHDRSAQTLRAQFLVLLLLAAVVGGLTKVLPFGPTRDGARLSLWLVPVFAIGTARFLTRLRDAVARRRVGSVAFDAVAVLAALLIAVYAATDSPRYLESGAQSATNFIEARLAPTSVVFVDHENGVYPYAVATHLHAAVRAQYAKVAFWPQFDDPRIHYLAFTGPSGADLLLTAPPDALHPHNVVGAIGNATEVFLYLVAPNNVTRSGTPGFASLLRNLGFGPAQSVRFDNARVLAWHRHN
ncbi:MAG: hypothetical protein QOC79_1020 [Actinomycetota bacterium]|nr:hypothetical protein [Actinomycetota bacterium]